MPSVAWAGMLSRAMRRWRTCGMCWVNQRLQKCIEAGLGSRGGGRSLSTMQHETVDGSHLSRDEGGKYRRTASQRPLVTLVGSLCRRERLTPVFFHRT